MSFDPPAENAAWAADEGFAFELWTDDDKDLALWYRAIEDESASAPSRITVLLGGSGDLLLEYRDGIDVGTHPQDVLADCETLFGGG